MINTVGIPPMKGPKNGITFVIAIIPAERSAYGMPTIFINTKVTIPTIVEVNILPEMNFPKTSLPYLAILRISFAFFGLKSANISFLLWETNLFFSSNAYTKTTSDIRKSKSRYIPESSVSDYLGEAMKDRQFRGLGKIKKVIANVPSFNAEYSIIKGDIKINNEESIVTHEDVMNALEVAVSLYLEPDNSSR